MDEDLKKIERACSAKFLQQAKENLPKMKKSFSEAGLSPVHLNYESCELDSRGILNSPIPNQHLKPNFSKEKVFEIISKIKDIEVKDTFLHYSLITGPFDAMNQMEVSSAVESQNEESYPSLDTKYDSFISDYLRNKRPTGKISTETFMECESDSDEEGIKNTVDNFKVKGTLKVSYANKKKKGDEDKPKLVVTGTDNLGRDIQACLSQQDGERRYFCKISDNKAEIYNGVEYFGYANFHDKYLAMSLGNSFYKLYLENGEFKRQLILKYARFINASKLLLSPNHSQLIEKYQKTASNILWSCTWEHWEHIGDSLLTNISNNVLEDIPIEELFERGLELGAPSSLVESLHELFNLLDSGDYNESDALKILQTYKTTILPSFNTWFNTIKQRYIDTRPKD